VIQHKHKIPLKFYYLVQCASFDQINYNVSFLICSISALILKYSVAKRGISSCWHWHRYFFHEVQIYVMRNYVSIYHFVTLQYSEDWQAMSAADMLIICSLYQFVFIFLPSKILRTVLFKTYHNATYPTDLYAKLSVYQGTARDEDQAGNICWHTMCTLLIHICLYTYIYIYTQKKACINGYRVLTCRNWGGSVGIVTRLLVLRKRTRGLIPIKDNKPRSTVSRLVVGLSHLLPSGHHYLLLWGEKRLGRETDNLPLSSAEVKNEWRCTSSPHHVFLKRIQITSHRISDLRVFFLSL
jgi:hypothetical protein